jgi:hypothetical protein
MKKIIFVLTSLLMICSAQATIYYVSPTGSGTNGLTWATAYTSPAAALAGAPVAGDEVWVQQGTYVSATTLNWKTGINFYGGFVGTETARSQRSTDASLTILEGTNTNRVLNAPQMASATTWSGFTIQKGLASGGGAGIFMQRNAILENCIVQNNKDTNWGGAGIYIQSGDVDSIKVINCIIRNNITTSTDTRTDKHGGGGIRIRPDASKAVIRNCVIEDNMVDGLAGANSGVSGGGIYMAAGTLENSIVRNNIATNKNASTQALLYSGKCQGGGVFIMPQVNSNTITVKNCTISANTANTSVGGGIAIDPLWTSAVVTSPVIISNNLIINNSAYRTGGGIMTDGQAATSTASYTFENCVIANNESSTVAAGGGGAFVNNIADYAGTVSFNHCTVVNNKMLTTNYGGAGIFYNNIKADITNCVFWGNASVGAIAPYHVRVRTTLTTNKLLNCTFDSRFVESQVSPEGFEANLAGKVIVGLANTGTENGVLYARFESPTNFVGKALTEGDAASLAAANWALKYGSAMQDKGTTLAGITKDIIGKARPQGSAYDIGAYEKEIKQVSTQQNASVLQLQQSSSAVIVGNGGTLVVDENSAFSALVIERGGRVNNINGNSITLTDSLIINSDANGTGAYVEKNNSTMTAGGTRVRQYLTEKSPGEDKSDNWWYISSPVSGASSASILVEGFNNKFGYYNETDASYPQITATYIELEAGKGYLAQINTTGTYSFNGTLNTGNVGPITLTRTPSAGGPRGFNLVGNPYPSHIDWNSITGFGTDNVRSDIRPTVWARTRTDGGAMAFDTFDGTVGTSLGKNGQMNRYIAPMQAFWVKVHADNTSPTITFTNTMRSAQDQSGSTNRLKAPVLSQHQVLRLELHNCVNRDEAIIATYHAAQAGYDFYDSEKMSANTTAIAELYSLVADKELVINKRNSIEQGASVILGFRPGQAGSFSIKATEMVNLDNVKVILKDNQLNTETVLQPEVSYSFTSDATATNNRFSIEFRAPGAATSVNEVNASNTLVFVNEANQIAVQIAGVKEASISVFNLAGQQLATQQAEGQLTVLAQPFSAGVYLVKVNNHLQKVIVK